MTNKINDGGKENNVYFIKETTNNDDTQLTSTPYAKWTTYGEDAASKTQIDPINMD